MKRLLLTVLLVIIPLQLGFLFLNNTSGSSGKVAGIRTYQSDNIINSFFIGDHRFNLFGYTSPYALVTFEGMGIFDTTTADNQGYFQFDNRFSPFSSREACLSSKDQFGRLSSPLCLPPFPVNYNVNIGPVIMPPTVSLDKKNYFIGDEIILSGQAVPNTEVNLSVFGNNSKNYNFTFIKPVEAFTFPELVALSDNKGNFSVNLPSTNPKKFRLFAQTNFKKNISPNSIKLNFDILPIWMIIFKFFLFIFSLIKPRLLEITIALEIFYILCILRSRFQDKAIIKYQSNFPVLEESYLPIIEEEKPLIKY